MTSLNSMVVSSCLLCLKVPTQYPLKFFGSMISISKISFATFCFTLKVIAVPFFGTSVQVLSSITIISLTLAP
jgi:hypothetical protein